MGKLNSPWVTGMASGAAATLIMSAVMIASKRAGIMRRDYPPRKITRELVTAATNSPPSQTPLNALTTANHFAYGMGGGGLFAAIRRACGCRGNPILQGIAYALLVWAGSYKGWVPGLRIMPAPEDDEPGRVGTMVAAHVVYGAILGMSQEVLETKR